MAEQLPGGPAARHLSVDDLGGLLLEVLAEAPPLHLEDGGRLLRGPDAFGSKTELRACINMLGYSDAQEPS
ncbi:MAG: hypothetical protein ACLQMH_11745 [Solirubrobacteraceae bacterium]